MNNPLPNKDLAALHDLISRLETGEIALRRGLEDVSEHGIGVLRAALARLETTLAHKESERKSDQPINYSGRTKRFTRGDK